MAAALYSAKVACHGTNLFMHPLIGVHWHCIHCRLTLCGRTSSDGIVIPPERERILLRRNARNTPG